MRRWQWLVPMLPLLLLAAVLRLVNLGSLPPGFSNREINTLRITEHVSMGQIVVFEQTANGQGQETLFHIIQATTANLFGDGLITLRLPAVWIGLITLALLYSLAHRLHGQRVALLATGLMAVGFWPVLLSRLSLREVLVPCFTTATLLAFTNALHIRRDVSPDRPMIMTFSALGIVIAASLYAHWYGLFLAVFVTLAIIYLYMSRQAISRHTLSASLFAILLSLIIMIPYIATTLRFPAFSGLASLRQAMMPESVFRSLFEGLAAFLARGDMNPLYNVPGRPLLDPVTGLLFFFGLGWSLRFWRRPAYFLPALAALLGLIPVLLSTQPAAYLNVVGGLPMFYLLAAIGANELLHQASQRGPQARRAVLVGMVVLVAGNLVWTTIDLGRWGQRQDVRTAYHANRGLLAGYLDRTAGDTPTVVCSPGLVDTVGQPGDPHLLRWMMQRNTQHIRYVDCANGIVIEEGGAAQQFAFTDRSIIPRMYTPLTGWLQNATPIPVDGLAEASVVQLSVAEELEDTVGRLLTTSPTGWAPESPGGAEPVTLPARFGGNITFLGYEYATETAYQGGDVIPVMTYWRADGDVPPDLRIFTHLLSDPAAIVTQSSAMNVWPSTLRSRDIFIQINYLVLPPNIPPGTYDISIGAYRAEGSDRMPIYDGDTERGDRLFLHQITVAQNG